MQAALDSTYKVWYFGGPPHFILNDDNLPKMDYTQAINVASRWMKDGREIEIRDGDIPVMSIVLKGVKFVTFDPNQTRFEEHVKIKIALDKVWGEIWSKRLRW